MGTSWRPSAAFDGVATAAGNRVADWRYAGGPITIDAYDASYFSAIEPEGPRFIGGHAPDAAERLAAGEAVLVSSNFAYNIGVRAGDTLTLATPSGPLSRPSAGIV